MHSAIPARPVLAPAAFASALSRAGKLTLSLFSVAVLLAGGVAVVRGQSALDAFDPNANGSMNVVVAQPDGKIIIGGSFTSVAPNGGVAFTRNHIARFNSDGTLDLAFNPNANGEVFSIVPLGDGKVLVGGLFTSIGGQPRNRIARLEAGTGAADAFDPNANDYVNAIGVQADGKVVAAGQFTSMGGQARNRIARLEAGTGAVDAAFDPNANSPILSIAVQADGKILAGGFFTAIGGQTRNRIARLEAATGAVDAGFDPNASSTVFAIALQADGKILAGGFFTTVGGQTRNRIARLEPANGAADAFNPNANESVRALMVQSDGNVLVGGEFTAIGGQTRNRFARLDPATGAPDAFDPNVTGTVSSIAVQPDGKVLAGGFFNNINGQTRRNIARLESNGRLDQTLVDLSTIGGAVLATAVQPDGKTVIGGNFTTVVGVERNNIARLNTDGTLDTSFNPNANGDVHAIAVQADGKVLAGGNFFGANSIGGQTRNFIARLDATTGLADLFDANADNIVGAIAVQGDGKILAGGVFTSIGGQMRSSIARLDAATGLADSFDPNANKSGFVNSIALQTDGKILIGGNFGTLAPNGGPVVTRNSIARLNSDGTLDPFDPNSNDIVNAIALQADGKVLACGQFTNIGGQARNFIARLDAITGLADSFDPSANSFLYALAVQADGRILASGAFEGANSIGGQARNFIARLNANGTADSFDPNADGEVRSITVQADGKILAGGIFSTIGGQTRNLFARLSNDTAALQNLAVTQNAVAWTRGGSSPQFTHVTFEHSTDHVNYSPLGNGMAAGSNWTLTGLSLPTGQNIYIRARGYYRSGFHNGSESLTESVRFAFVTAVPATIIVSGTISYCSNPIPGPVPGVTLTLSGSGSSSTLSDGSGNYALSSLLSGGTYTVTPTKPALAPGAAGISTADVIAIQRHFLGLGTPLSGCRLTASDVDLNASVNTVDAVAIQRFFLGMSTGIANVGKYRFSPASRSYSPLVSDQTGQNYDAVILGDAASGFVPAPRPDGGPEKTIKTVGLLIPVSTQRQGEREPKR